MWHFRGSHTCVLFTRPPAPLKVATPISGARRPTGSNLAESISKSKAIRTADTGGSAGLYGQGWRTLNRLQQCEIGAVNARRSQCSDSGGSNCASRVSNSFANPAALSHTHPKNIASLESTCTSLQSLAHRLNGFEVRVERDGLVIPKMSEAPLPDSKGDLKNLAADFQLAGIQTLVVLRQFHVGELDTLAQLIRASLLKSDAPSKRNQKSWWSAKLLEFGVEGIQVNAQTDRRVDSVLASLIAALVAFGGNTANEDADAPLTAPTIESLSAVLHLISRLTLPLESARGLSPEEAARAIHGALGEARRETVHLLLSSISQHSPREAETPQACLLRLSEQIILETLSAEFAYGQLPPQDVSKSLQSLGNVLVSAGGYFGPHSSQHLSSLAAVWAEDVHREKMLERFWMELPPREKSSVLRGPDSWCVPVPAIRAALRQLADAGADAPAGKLAISC